MLVHIPEVLTAEEVADVRSLIAGGPWADGRITAGTQSAAVKNNRQLPEQSVGAKAAGAVVLRGLARHGLFFSAALAKKVYPPLFNRYEGQANAFGAHVDNAMRTVAESGRHVRTDLSATLFLSEPETYDGGELVVQDVFGDRRIKLPAGDLVLYPGTSVHRVEPVTRGVREASFFWIESMVRSDEQRRLLFDLDLSIVELRGSVGETEAVVRLTACYHNLLRQWADT